MSKTLKKSVPTWDSYRGLRPLSGGHSPQYYARIG